MKDQKKGSWFSRVLKDARDPLFGLRPHDTVTERAMKTIGWYMFLFLMCGVSLAGITGLMFAH